MLNIVKDLGASQGLSKTLWYCGTVTDNNDPEKLGRIRLRIPVIFDGIGSDDLPWAIPEDFSHCDGASAYSGVVSIPKCGTKIRVRFQEGNPLYPVYGGYHVDRTTQLQESLMNYPDRHVFRMQNQSLLVIDTKANIIYCRSPGDLRVCVVGNAQLEVFGNLTEVVHGNVTRQVDGNVDETINGNLTRTVKGSYKEHVVGTRHARTDGNYLDSVGGTRNQYSSGSSTLKAGSTLALEGSTIQENSGAGASDPGSAGDAKSPQLSDWPGIRGGAPGDGFVPTATPEDIISTNIEGEVVDPSIVVPANNEPEVKEKNEEKPAAQTVPPKDCAEFEKLTEFPPTLQLSSSFNLGGLSTNTALSRYAVQDQQGLTKAQIVCNLSNLAKSALDKISSQFGKPTVTSGFRTGSGSSWHTKGSAADMQWPGISDAEYYTRACWIKDNVPFSELILEYGANRPWVHVAYNQGSVSTSNFKTRVSVNNVYKPGILKLTNKPGVGGV